MVYESMEDETSMYRTMYAGAGTNLSNESGITVGLALCSDGWSTSTPLA